jgi:succinate dehydrogenase/fumarate reductase flavoprotein subunit
MAAAVAAATNGATVTVLEAAARFGGTTATAGGGLWVPANPWAAAHGVEDSVEAGVGYLRSLQRTGDDAALPEAYVRNGVRIVELAERSTPLRWHHLVEFPDYYPEREGGSVHGRCLEARPVQVPRDIREQLRPDPYSARPITINEEASPPDEVEVARRIDGGILTRGRGLVAALYLALREHGGEVRTGVRATELLGSGDAVAGVRAGGAEFRGHVIVATGGFERNVQLVRTFLRGPMLGPAGPPSNRGDAVEMGMAIGAALENMSDAWWVAAAQIPGEQIDGAPFFRMLFAEAAKPGGIIVDSGGRRFGDEAMPYYGFGRRLHELDGFRFTYPRIPSWFVFDARRRAEQPIGPVGPADADPDWLARAESVERLGEAIGVTGTALRDTVERFNTQAASGRDEDFGRGSGIWDVFHSGAEQPLRPLLEPPFYALRVLPGCSGTKGGLRIDEHGRVMRQDRAGPIPGLYAAGNASAYMLGAGYAGPGAPIGAGFIFGWLAGETAAASALG